MTRVKDIVQTKPGNVVTVDVGASVLEAAGVMNEHRIGALVVTEAGRMAGICTERDVLRRVVAPAKDPAKTTVGQVMTSEVACCSPQTDIEEARSVMKNRRIRHLPVLNDDGDLMGMISIGDLNAFHADVQEHTIQMLQQYLHER